MAGNTYDLVVLSSSPPAASPQNHGQPRRVAMPPSSPLDFAPLTSLKATTTGASKPNPRAAAIPEGAARGFATVGSLVRSEHFTSRLDKESEHLPQAQPRLKSLDITEGSETLKKPRKRPPKHTAAADGSEKSKPKPRARKPKADEEVPAPDPDLRVPTPTTSPFFDVENPEAAVDPPNKVAPKLTKSGKPRKPRAKKQIVDEGGEVTSAPKAKKERATKPKAAKDGKAQREDASIVSAHFPGNANTGDKSAVDVSGRATSRLVEAQAACNKDASIWEVPQSPRPKKKAAPKQRPPGPVAEGLDLEEAVLRRRDWTPPRDTTVQSPFTDSTGKENKLLVQNTDGTFTNLISNFAYAQSPSAQNVAKIITPTTEAMAVTKRRRVELYELPNNQTNSRDCSPEKGKAPRKKPRTITDLVTGQYGPKDLELDPNAVSSNFFEPCTTVTKVALNDTSAPNSEAVPKKAPRKRNSSKPGFEKGDARAKSKKAPARSTAKSKPVAEKLLSPTSALLRLNRQDVLFGTSSQLALEESPTMVRQLQFAIKESEQDASTLDSLAAPPQWPKLGKVQGKRALWAASARDDDGGTLEHMGDVYIPAPDRTQDIPLLMDGTNDAPDEPPSFIDIDDLESQPSPQLITLSSDLPTPPRTTSQPLQPTELASNEYTMKSMSYEDIERFEQEPPPSNQKVDSQDSFADIDDFDFLPSAQMRTSPAQKFKPPTSTTSDGSPNKRRGRPLKARSAIPTVGASSKPMLKPSTSHLRPKARAKEEEVTPLTSPKGSGRFIDIEEILDSEDEALEALSPTPPRVRKFVDSEPLPLISLSPMTSPTKAKKSSNPKSTDPTLTLIHRIPTAKLEWANVKTEIFAAITSHIRSLPPTTDPTKPTWHEKILMYDPINLEDFTAYLNANTPIHVYKKATQKQIKAWNQQRKANGDAILDIGAGGEDVLGCGEGVGSVHGASVV